MSRNLKNKINKIILILVVVIIGATLLGYIYIQTFSKVDISSLKPSIENPESKTEVVVSGNVITCDSIVQGVRDVDLPNRKLYFFCNWNCRRKNESDYKLSSRTY